MGKFIYSDDDPSQWAHVRPTQRVYVQAPRPRRYGCFGFLFDCFMTIITSGLWLIWVFVREMRRGRR